MTGDEEEAEDNRAEGELRDEGSEVLGFKFKLYQLAVDREYISFFVPSVLHLSGLLEVAEGQMDMLRRGTESHTTVN